MYVATCKTQVRGSGRERKIEAGRESASEQERELLASHSSVAAVELRAWFYHTIQGLHVSVKKRKLMMMMRLSSLESPGWAWEPGIGIRPLRLPKHGAPD